MIETFAVAGWKDQVGGCGGQPPSLQRVHHHGAERDGALPRPRLRPAEHPVAVRTLADVELAALEIYVVPPQAPQFGSTQAGQGRQDQQWARALRGGCEDAPDLVGGGDVT